MFEDNEPIKTVVTESLNDWGGRGCQNLSPFWEGTA